MPRISERQVHRMNLPATTAVEYYRRAVYLPLLDCIISDINARFTDNMLATLSELSQLIPANVVKCARVNLSELLQRYGTFFEESARNKARELNTGRATRPCTSGAGCHFDTDNHAPKKRVHYVF